MKKFILCITGILALTSISICSATNYYYYILNYTDEDLWFTWRSGSDKIKAEPSEFARSGAPGSIVMIVKMTPNNCGGGGDYSAPAAAGDCKTSGHFQFSVGYKGNQQDYCIIEYNYKDNYYPQPNNDNGKTINCQVSPTPENTHWYINIRPIHQKNKGRKF